MRASSVNSRLTIIRFLVYLLPILFFSLLIIYDLNPSGVRILDYNIGDPSSDISRLFPAHRLLGIDQGRQEVIAEPIYFKVRIPHRYDTAYVEVEVDNPVDLNWQIGLEVFSDSEWSYFFADNNNGRALFDLARAKIVDRQIRFVISAQGLANDTPFRINNIRIKLERPTLSNIIKRKI